MTGGSSREEGFALTTEDDDFVRDRPRWVATLTDGTTVYMDDGRAGVDPPSAWVRLRSYCKASGLRIAGLRLQFRSNTVELPPAKPAYFFAKAALGAVGGEAADLFVVGYLEDGVIRTTTYEAVGLKPLGQGVRALDVDSPSVIH